MQVLEFQNAFGVESPTRPKLLNKKRAELRHNLLQEEVDEIMTAIKGKDIVSLTDGVIDSMYILIGTAHEYGFADRMEQLFDEVHRSNMSKMGPDGKPILRKDGKVLKPETYSPPKLEAILNRDFSLYKENNVLQQIAEEEKKRNENLIINKIKSKLNIADRIMYYVYEVLESYLKKKVSVKFPIRADQNIIVTVYGEDYVVE